MSPIGSNRAEATKYTDYRPSRCRCGSVVQPHEAVCPRCRRHQNLLFAGLDRLYEQDLDNLVDYHESRVRENPSDYLRIHHLAGAHLLKGDYDKASDLYRKVLQLKPDFAEAHLNLGGILACLGSVDEAVSEFREFVRLDIHSPRVERAVRAICSLKNIPYEDALQETGVKELTNKKGKVSRDRDHIGGLKARGTMYERPAPVIYKRKAWGAIDLFLLFLFILAALAYYFYPNQSKGILRSAVTGLETQLTFNVNSAESSGDENPTGEEETDDGDDDGPSIINADPGTNSFMPLAAGNRWEYTTWDSRDPTGGGSRENESSVDVRVVRLVNAESGVWETRNGPNTAYYIEKRTGLYSTLNPDFPWSTSYTQVPYPPTDGQIVTDNDQIATVMSTEVVTTSMGMFECVKIHYVDTRFNDLEWYAWYGKGVGLVKYVGGGNRGIYHVRELRFYELN